MRKILSVSPRYQEYRKKYFCSSQCGIIGDIPLLFKKYRLFKYINKAAMAIYLDILKTMWISIGLCHYTLSSCCGHSLAT